MKRTRSGTNSKSWLESHWMGNRNPERFQKRGDVMDDALLNVTEAAALLGIAPGSLYHWLSEGRGIPVVRLSARCLRFRRTDLEAWITEKAQGMTACHRENKPSGR
jgi:excisionase family DNA binding protein